MPKPEENPLGIRPLLRLTFFMDKNGNVGMEVAATHRDATNAQLIPIMAIGLTRLSAGLHKLALTEGMTEAQLQVLLAKTAAETHGDPLVIELSQPRPPATPGENN